MKDSIKVRLAVTFTLVSVLVAVFAGGVSFYDIYRETYKLQDDLLKQISAYINASDNYAELADSDNDARISVYILNRSANSTDIRLPRDIADGFHTLKKDGRVYKIVSDKKNKRFFYTLRNAGDLYRTYVRTTGQKKVIVMQENEYREELAIHSAWTSVIPLLVLLPLITLLTIIIVQYTMRPIYQLSQKVEKRHEQDLTPLSVKNIPSEIKGFVVAINNLLKRTNQFIQQQKRFIADASHELRSPMTALSLQIERLSEQNLPEPARGQLAQLKQGIGRSRNLLEQLLSLARVQNSETRQTTEIRLQALFRRVIEDVLPLVEEKDQDIGVISEDDPVFSGNETDLYLLVKTLVDNAIRYTPNGSRIDLSAVELGNTLIIQVEDNGSGISAEERSRVLDPFYRILGSDQQGSGLGLAIASSIVKNYNGEMILSDSTHFDHGLLVTIKLNK